MLRALTFLLDSWFVNSIGLYFSGQPVARGNLDQLNILMASSIYLLGLLVPSILVSILIGAYVGYGFALRRHGQLIHEEREKTLEALQNVVESADQLTEDVDTRNHELQSVEESVDDLRGVGGYEHIKQTLLNQISEAIDSNRRLENDLVCTRYRLEEQAQELDHARLEARIDALSGVGNRKAFDESLRFMISQSQRSRSTFGLVMIDVDHFKWINDTHGHQSGDYVVKRLGETFKSLISKDDHIARFGGDEFGIMFANVDQDAALEAAQRIRDKVEQTNFDSGVGSNRVAVTLSMGMAICEPTDSAESLLKKADAALYHAKEAGRNRLTVFDLDMLPAAV